MYAFCGGGIHARVREVGEAVAARRKATRLAQRDAPSQTVPEGVGEGVAAL